MILLGKSFNNQYRLSVLFIVLGVAMTTAGEIDFNWVRRALPCCP